MSDRLDRTPSVGSDGQALFSLVEAATIARPIPTARDPSIDSVFSPGSFNGPSSLTAAIGSTHSGTSKAHAAMKHRRLSSTGQARRRLSDAREATSRPSPVILQTAAAALSSLATLSLSGSPPPQSNAQASTSFASATGQMSSRYTPKLPKQEATDENTVPDDASSALPTKTEINGAGISVTKTGKKRGTIFKCESCSKVYRHPSCLIKHRWEHSPHWREASKFLLSKHQQVQLLEAAAILSHLDPSATGGRSLPDDRSLWPSFLSGGLLPPPDAANTLNDSARGTPKARSSSVAGLLDQPDVYPVSSSVPAASLLSASAGGRILTRSPSAGPRMHDYALPSSGGITHVRPGVVGVPMNNGNAHPDAPLGQPLSISYTTAQQQRSAPVPVPVPAARDTYREPRCIDANATGGYSFVSTSGASASEAWSSPVSVGFAQSSFRSSSATSHSAASVSGLERSFSSEGAGAWSLPRSSVRSSSLSRSRSRSGSIEDNDGDYVDVDVSGVGEDAYAYGHAAGPGRFGFTSRGWKMDMDAAARARNGKIEEEDWDGMEMEMEM
ncbi:hypothetical protein BC628DRAFT_1373591 [Trametes gibbosa]|uniref:Zinc finger protein 219 n=1 Tax=Trametes gibbosa TaxID=160864 RepID=A0A6B9KD21_9APHY|nr:hypothetical protein BC628DRAFT_1373591 [Trametes gibbosa]QHA24592.1 zinc finger protein 219 [Trametes gibbosa]